MTYYLDNRKVLLEKDLNRLKLVSPLSLIRINENIVKEITINLNNTIDKYLIKEHHYLDNLINTLKLVNPLNILSNGYSLVKKDNKVIKDVKDLKVKDKITIKFHKGEVTSEILEVRND